jgi:hypothetical protein
MIIFPHLKKYPIHHLFQYGTMEVDGWQSPQENRKAVRSSAFRRAKGITA